jgi:predicted amidohydrolase
MPDKKKIKNSHIMLNNKGELIAVYRKVHLFDMDNKETGVRLMESDYVEKGCEIIAPVLTPVGKIGLTIVCFCYFCYILNIDNTKFVWCLK